MRHLQNATWGYIDLEVYVLREEMAMIFDREFPDLPPLPEFHEFD